MSTSFSFLNRYLRLPLDHPLRFLYHQLRAVAASFLFLFPANGLIVIGVTGTDGKTTTCNMIAQILRQAGHKVGVLTTALISDGEETRLNTEKMTSLDPFLMHRYLRKMVAKGCTHVVLETSSHALFYRRVWGINYDVAALTHIASDHLDLHGTVENYKNTKKILFEELATRPRKNGVSKVMVLNADDEYYAEFRELAADRHISYSQTQSATVRATDPVASGVSTSCQIHLGHESAPLTLSIPGAFNVENALCALGVAIGLKIDLATAIAGLQKFSGVPGRMELVRAGQPFKVIVDYAHTVDALEKVLKMIKPYVDGRLFLVFGATGDRDRSKRADMGRVAEKYADEIILTDDDPYTENRMSILQQVRQGITRPIGQGVQIIPDRRIAIKTAVFLANERDYIVLTGKGAEQVLVTNEGPIPWDDRTVVRECIAERLGERD